MTPHDPLLTLVVRLGVATVAQLRDHCCAGDDDLLRLVLRSARAGGWVDVSTELIRPWSHNGKPLAIVEAGRPLPNPGRLAYEARHLRWSRDVALTGLVRPTAKLANFHGARPIPAGHLAHAVAVAEVLLQKKSSDPDFSWSLVSSKPGKGSLADAICAGGAVEIIGAYNRSGVVMKLSIAASMNRLELW